MPNTAYTDLIIPSILNTDTMVDFTKKFDFAMRGVASRIDAGPGHFMNMRKWNELVSTTVQRMTSNGSYAVRAGSQNEDITPILHMIDKFGADDLAKRVSGEDVTGALASMLAQYWVGVTRDKLLIVLGSLFNRTGGLLATSNKNDVFVDANTGQVYLTPAGAIDGLAKLGANMEDIAVWAMHSLTKSKLDKANFLETNVNTSAYGNSGELVKTFLGKPIMVDDSCTAFAGTTCTLGGFRTYGLGIGSMAMGIQAPISTEMLRSENAADLLITQFHSGFGVRGCAWNSATVNPTDAQLATVSNWSLAYASAKLVRVVAIDHN